nr:hypothetical protein Itr_chr05CG10920 [Ipomoea trifida]
MKSMKFGRQFPMARDGVGVVNSIGRFRSGAKHSSSPQSSYQDLAHRLPAVASGGGNNRRQNLLLLPALGVNRRLLSALGNKRMNALKPRRHLLHHRTLL